jgi:UPF0755 protein
MVRRIIIIIAAVLLVTGAGAVFYFYRLFTTPVSVCDDYRIFITPTDTRQSILAGILESDPDARTKALDYLLKRRDYDSHIHTGCYTVKSGATPKQVSNMLLSGAQTPVRLTINSTRTVGQMARAIAGQIMTDSAQIASRLCDASFLDSLGYTPATVFCMIIPNTYEVYWNTSADALISRLVKERDRFWNRERLDKAGSIGLTPEQVTTLASIVEEETAKTDELPVVAGLYMNRLHRNMLLQADPTVIYALGGERPKRVLKVHLEVDSPYNTYRYPGLPPAPIRFVSTRSIDAVLNYSRHNYLYMCAKEDFSGYHNFTSSLSQHNANAARYQRALRNAGIR